VVLGGGTYDKGTSNVFAVAGQGGPIAAVPGKEGNIFSGGDGGLRRCEWGLGCCGCGRGYYGYRATWVAFVFCKVLSLCSRFLCGVTGVASCCVKDLVPMGWKGDAMSGGHIRMTVHNILHCFVHLIGPILISQHFTLFKYLL
jgi:hypothetical protein